MNRPLNHLVSRESVDVRIASPVDGSAVPTSAHRELAPAMHVPRKLRSIVVPVDGTPFGEHAIPVALGIAERSGAELILVHVHSPLQFESRANRMFPDGVLDEWLLRERRDCLNVLVRRVAYATTVRGPYDAGGGYSGATFTIGFHKTFDPLILNAFVSLDDLRGAVFENSPLVKTRSSWMCGFSVSWIFRKSSERVTIP